MKLNEPVKIFPGAQVIGDVEIGENSYKGKTKLSVLERSVKLLNPDFSGLEEVDFLTAIFNVVEYISAN